MDEGTYAVTLERDLEGRSVCVKSLEAMVVTAHNFNAVADRDVRLLHAAMGMSTEAGEFLDALKKLVVYGKPLDRTNLIEELGDILWYMTLATIALGVTLDDVREINIAKLRKRYPNKFTQHDALNRDLEGERRVLEGN